MKKTLRWMIAAVVLLMPMVYVASIGPAAWATARGYLHPAFFNATFLPLRWISYRSPAIDAQLRSYTTRCWPYDGKGFFWTDNVEYWRYLTNDD